MYHGHMIRVTATEHKHQALKLLEQVRISGEVIQITKRGRPIAQLIRIDGSGNRVTFGKFRDDVQIVGDIVGPIGDPSDWGELACS